MKLITYKKAGRLDTGLLVSGDSRVLPVGEVLPAFRGKKMEDLIRIMGERERNLLRKAAAEEDPAGSFALREAELLSPIVRPIHDILCVGVNYASHRAETDKFLTDEHLDPPKSIYFSKRACRIIGPEEEIENHLELDPELDYEVELAVIIGKTCRDVKAEDAEDVIFGYSVFNDLSSRTLQRDHVQWLRGKSLDTYSAMGPAIVTKDELPFPLRLDVISRVNGKERQHSNTELLLRTVGGIIEDLSSGMTLEPGDIIATGTPAGVGMGMEPKGYMKAGDIVECEIPGIGILRNRVKK